MVQLSSFSLYPATQEVSTLPGLTVRLTPNVPFKTVLQDGGPAYSIQFNFMGIKGWNQFVFVFGFPGSWTGPQPPPGTYATNFGLDSMQTAIQFEGAMYVDLQPLAEGGAFPATTLDPNKWQAGDYYVELKYSSAGVVTVEVRSKADDSVVWSGGPYTPADPSVLPSVLSVEIVGKYSGESSTFLACDVELEFYADEPLYGVMNADATVWTYNDGVNGVHPLMIANETGESSNLWTNVISQSPTALILGLSLIQGSQVFDNPPLAPPSPTNLYNSALPTVKKVGDYTGVSTSWTNPTPSPIPAIVFVVLKNSEKQTVGVATASITVAPNSTEEAICLFVDPPPHGTYTANASVWSPNNRPIIGATASTSVTL